MGSRTESAVQLTTFEGVTHRTRVARATLVVFAFSALLSVGADAASTPDRIEAGASAPECPAERFRHIYPVNDDQYAVEQRVKFGLPTDPATRDRADMETEQRGDDNTVEIGVTVTDAENAAFRRFEDYTERLEPLRAYFEAIPDVTGTVAFNLDYLDPRFTVQTLAAVSDEQLAEIKRLTPADIPTATATVEWAYAELLTLLYDIDTGVRGKPSVTGAFERIESVGLVPHGGGLGAQQFVTVYVDDSDLGCDEQLTALVADAVADLGIPPILIEQSGRAQET